MDLTSSPDTVVLLDDYGMPGCDWTPWKERYTARGLRVLMPGWHGGGAIVEHYERVLEELDAAPIVMGHGFGGLLTQDLLERGCGAAGVAIDAAAVFTDADRGSLLFVGGDLDHLAPASLVAVAEKRYYRGGPITEYRPFPGLTDDSLTREGWEHAADYALEWALAHASVRPVVVP